MNPSSFNRSYVALFAVTWLVIALFSSPVLAAHSAPATINVSSAHYLNPNTGRFWTMDSFAGSKQEPLSLHRYLYCRSNPVNRLDPSGNFDFNFASLLTAGNIQAGMQGLRVVGVTVAKRVLINSLYGSIIGGAAGSWDAILGGGDSTEGLINGMQGGAAFGALGSFQCLQPVLQAIGISLGSVSTIQAASGGHYAQAGFRGIVTAVAAFSTKNWRTIDADLERPGSMTGAQTRDWYHNQLAEIPSKVDQGADWQTRAMQAYVARLMTLLRARSLMSDQRAAANLRPPRTLSSLVDKYAGRGKTGDALWQEIYNASMRSDPGYDARFQYGDAGVPFYLWDPTDKDEN